MNHNEPRRLPPHALAAAAGVTVAVLGCGDSVDSVIEDNVTLDTAFDQDDSITFVVPLTADESAGATVVLTFPGDNQVVATVTPPGGGEPSVSTGTASVTSDIAETELQGTVTLDDGPLAGQQLVLNVDYNLDGTGTYTLDFNGERVASGSY